MAVEVNDLPKAVATAKERFTVDDRAWRCEPVSITPRIRALRRQVRVNG